MANDQVDVIFTSSLIMSLFELCSRFVLCVLHIIGTGLYFHRSKINTCTLDELVRM
jgi:hypothetical protein